MKSICFLAQFPPPMHGLSKAVETLYDSRLKEKYRFSKINITDNKRILQSLWALLRCKTDLVYFTPSQTVGGNQRDLMFLKLIQWRGLPCLVHIHGGYYRQLVDHDCRYWQRRMNYNAVGRLAGGIVLGHSLHGIFEGMLPDDKIFVCPNCVDDVFIAPSVDEKMESLQNADGPLHILYLSNFIETKGYREVVELARMAQEKGAAGRFVFHFAGKFFDAAEEDWFKTHTRGLDNVVFHGVVSGQNKVDLLRQCHLFVLLSRYPNEGQPISILEAMGNGLAVITTDHAGIPEVADADNGYACSRHSIEVDKIYEYMTACDENRNVLSGVCRRNYETTKRKYTERQYIDNMDKIFERVCKR